MDMQITLLWVIPTMTSIRFVTGKSSGILSDIIFWHLIWHIFWHSIWHIFWHSTNSTWHIFCNMFWHIFWHSILHIFWHIFWHSIWHSIWKIFWHMFWQTFWHFIWHTFWHSIWHSIWHTFWHSIWHIFWHFIWHIFWHSIWHIFWYSTWHIFWHSIWHSTGISSGISSDILSGILSGKSSGVLSGKHSGTLSGIPSGILPDILSGIPSGVLSGISSGILSGRWGPAVLTELGGSQVEVQRCSLSSDGPRLRSSGAQCAQTLAVEVQQCPLRAEVGEELGEELARRKWTWKWRQRWWRRRRRRKRRRRRRTTLIKSNNPHLAGGEKHIYYLRIFETHRCLTLRLAHSELGICLTGNGDNQVFFWEWYGLGWLGWLEQLSTHWNIHHWDDRGDISKDFPVKWMSTNVLDHKEERNYCKTLKVGMSSHGIFKQQSIGFCTVPSNICYRLTKDFTNEWTELCPNLEDLTQNMAISLEKHHSIYGLIGLRHSWAKP